MAYYKTEPPYQHGDQAKVGILLANLGTPDAPDAKSLKRYLGQFLMDRRIVEIPRFIWCWICTALFWLYAPKNQQKNTLWCGLAKAHL